MDSVSVYIPFKDSASSLQEVLAAVAAQHYPIAELVLVDDGSEEPGSFSLPTSIPTRVVRHAKNLGVAAARNTALKETRGDLVVSFDADIVPHPNCLSELVAALAKDPSLVGIGGRVTERHTEELGDLFRATYMKQDRGEAILFDVDLFGGCTLYRRTALVAVGGYIEMLRNSFEDFDISRRIRQHGGKTLYNPNARAVHIKRDTIISAVDTLYRWSYPHWEGNQQLAQHNWLSERVQYPELYYECAVSSRLDLLDFKIYSDLTLALGRIRDCTEEKLRYAHLLYPVRAVLRDITFYRTCNGPQADEVQALFGKVLSILLRHFISATLASKLEHDSLDLIESLFGPTVWREYSELANETTPDLKNMLSDTAGVMAPIRTFVETYAAIISQYSKQ